MIQSRIFRHSQYRETRFIRATRVMTFNNISFTVFQAIELGSKGGGKETVMKFLQKRNPSQQSEPIFCTTITRHSGTLRLPKSDRELSGSASQAAAAAAKSGRGSKGLCAVLPPDLDLQPLDLWSVHSHYGEGVEAAGKGEREGEGEEEISILQDLYYMRLGSEQTPHFQQNRPPLGNTDKEESSNGNDAEDQKTPSEKETDHVTFNGPIPFHVHYAWFGQAEFSFRMYLCFLSTIHVAKAER